MPAMSVRKFAGKMCTWYHVVSFWCLFTTWMCFYCVTLYAKWLGGQAVYMVYNDKKSVIWKVYMSGVFKAMAGESIVELTALTADSYLNYLHKCPWEHTKKKNKSDYKCIWEDFICTVVM